MTLWTDLIDPAELTGYARASLAAYEAKKGTLARFLPNREVADTVVKFVQGSSGLVPIANFRAFDAEPTTGTPASGKRVTLELPALGQEIPVSEYQQLRARNANEDSIVNAVYATTDRVVRATSDAIELLRGIVLTTGRATINSTNFGADSTFYSDDDFGRKAGHTVAPASLWTSASVSRLTDLTSWHDAYKDENGDPAGCILMSTRVLRAIAAGNEFQTQLLNGAARPALRKDVDAVIESAELPPIVIYDRRIRVGSTNTRVIPDDRLLFLPTPVETDAWQDTELGATFWGETLTAEDERYNLESDEQPGLVAGVYRNEKPPMIAQVISDAIALPVLANANLSFVADVL